MASFGWSASNSVMPQLKMISSSLGESSCARAKRLLAPSNFFDMRSAVPQIENSSGELGLILAAFSNSISPALNLPSSVNSMPFWICSRVSRGIRDCAAGTDVAVLISFPVSKSLGRVNAGSFCSGSGAFLSGLILAS